MIRKSFVVGYIKPNGLTGPLARIWVSRESLVIESIYRPRLIFRTVTIRRSDVLFVLTSGWTHTTVEVQTMSGVWKLLHPNSDEVVVALRSYGYPLAKEPGRDCPIQP